MFSCSVMSNSITPWTAECQASLSFIIFWNLLKLMTISHWCHPTFLSTVAPFSSCLQSSSASGYFLMYWLFFFFLTSGGHNIGASASAWVLPKNTQGWFPLELTSLNSLQSKSLLQPWSSKVLRCSPSFMIQFSHPYMTTGKTITLTMWTFVNKVISLLCNTLSIFVIAFLPKSKHLLISWMQSVVILKPKKIKSDPVSISPPLFPMKWLDWMPWCMFFECWVLRQLFHCSLSPSSRDCLVPLHFLPLGWGHLHNWGYWYFSQQSCKSKSTQVL